jgi:hypothetical protein
MRKTVLNLKKDFLVSLANRLFRLFYQFTKLQYVRSKVVKYYTFTVLKSVLAVSRKGITLYRVPEFLSSHLNRARPHPSPASECVPPTWVLRGEKPSLAGEGVGVTQFIRLDRNSGTLQSIIPLRGELFHGRDLRSRKSRGTVALNT